MQAIILAAGSGRRLRPVTDNIPKCLLTINGQTILRRLIGQLVSFGITDIKVVVGYKKEAVKKETARIDECKLTLIENDRYEEDINILSLTLALQKNVRPFYLVEADCVFEDRCFSQAFNPQYVGKSVWFSMGDFTPVQHGGIIKSNDRNEVIEIQIVNSYREEHRGYKKMVGLLKVGENEIERYARYLFPACEQNIRQYYHMPWIEHIGEFKSYLCDMPNLKLSSFNTIDEYYKTKEVFVNETRET